MALNLVDSRDIKIAQNNNDISLNLDNVIVNTFDIENKLIKAPSVGLVEDALKGLGNETKIEELDNDIATINTTLGNKQDKVLSGTAIPTNDLGNDGDVYLQYE